MLLEYFPDGDGLEELGTLQAQMAGHSTDCLSHFVTRAAESLLHPGGEAAGIAAAFGPDCTELWDAPSGSAPTAVRPAVRDTVAAVSSLAASVARIVDAPVVEGLAALTAVELRETATLQALAEGGSGVVSTPSPATVRHLDRCAF